MATGRPPPAVSSSCRLAPLPSARELAMAKPKPVPAVVVVVVPRQKRRVARSLSAKSRFPLAVPARNCRAGPVLSVKSAAACHEP